MKFNKKKFFDQYRQEFGELNQFQVDGLTELLNLYEEYYGWWDSISEIANSLSQIKHESNSSFNPVVEGYYLGDKSKGLKAYFQGDSDRVRRFQKGLKYYPYFGIGHIQLTWKDNFEKHEKLLKDYFPELIEDFQNRTGILLDIVEHPSQVLDGKISFAIMTIGMQRGTFRAGRKLSDYKRPDGTFDHFNARDIVNGDKKYKVKDTNYTVGDKIQKDALKFEKILKSSQNSNEEKVTEVSNDDSDIKYSFDNNNNNSVLNSTPTPNTIPSFVPPSSEVINTNNVVIEKPEPKNFLSTLKKEIAGLLGINVSIQGFKDYLNQAQSFNLSHETWTYITISLVVVSLIYIVIRYLKYKEESKRDLEITKNLIQTNSTPTNTVVLANKDEMQNFAKLNYTLIHR